MNPTSRVSELTVEELMQLIEIVVRQVIHEEKVQLPPASTSRARLILPKFDVGTFPPNLTLSRSEIYGDDER